MNSIKCINPTCEAIIQVPPGATQVACPQCGTWHFPSESDFLEPAPFEVKKDDESEAYESVGFAPEREELIQGNTKVEEQPIGYLISTGNQAFRLSPGANTIGRKNCHIVLDDNTVSRKHCVIEVNQKPSGTGWEYILYDIGHTGEKPSTNGVFVGGRSMRLENHERIVLGKGSEVVIGRVKLILQW